MIEITDVESAIKWARLADLYVDLAKRISPAFPIDPETASIRILRDEVLRLRAEIEKQTGKENP